MLIGIKFTLALICKENGNFTTRTILSTSKTKNSPHSLLKILGNQFVRMRYSVFRTILQIKIIRSRPKIFSVVGAAVSISPIMRHSRSSKEWVVSSIKFLITHLDQFWSRLSIRCLCLVYVNYIKTSFYNGQNRANPITKTTMPLREYFHLIVIVLLCRLSKYISLFCVMKAWSWSRCSRRTIEMRG